MAFNVRVFYYQGLQQIPNVLAKQFSSDSVYQLVEPYLGQSLVAVSAAAASTTTAPDGTNVCRIEVPDGQTIRYEINPPNRSGGVVIAGNTSPSLSGKDVFYVKSGWSISMVDASALP